MRSIMSEDQKVPERVTNDRLTKPWNVLATAKNHEQGRLARRLKRLGDFWWSPYLGLLIGRVEDHQAFLDQLRRNEESDPQFLHPLARLVPIDRTFNFTVSTLLPLLGLEVLGYADRIGNGSFHVRVERRGHKGEIDCRQVEQRLAAALIESLTQRGRTPHVDFRDPDFIIAVEVVGDECGVGFITKSMRERYPFVKVP